MEKNKTMYAVMLHRINEDDVPMTDLCGIFEDRRKAKLCMYSYAEQEKEEFGYYKDVGSFEISETEDTFEIFNMAYNNPYAKISISEVVENCMIGSIGYENEKAKQMIVRKKYDKYVIESKKEPLYANCIVKFKDEDTENEYAIKLGEFNGDFDDDRIFFYAHDINGLIGLMNENNGEDFVILNVDSFDAQL